MPFNFSKTKKGIIMLVDRHVCKDCGEELYGDGYSTPLVCPFNDDPEVAYAEPDSGPWYCGFEETAE